MSTHAYVAGVGMVSSLGLDVETTWAAICAGRTGIQADVLQHAGRKYCAAKIDPVSLPSIADLWPMPLEKQERRRRTTLIKLMTAPNRLSLMSIQQLPFSLLSQAKLGFFSGTNPCLPGKEGRLHELPEEMRILVEHSWSTTGTAILTSPQRITGPIECSIAGCCAGAYAIGGAFEQLLLGNADFMLAGAAETFTSLDFIQSFADLGALSPSALVSHAIRPFDLNRQGTVLGEGAAHMLLSKMPIDKPVAKLVAFVRGTDFHDPTNPDPSGIVLAEAFNLALAKAGISASQLGYINVHGTGTKNNDIAEANALRLVLADVLSDVWVGSTKPATGHQNAAAGAIEAVITCLALRDQVIPPHLFLENRDPLFDGFRIAPQDRAISHSYQYSASINLAFAGGYSILIFGR